MAFPQSAVTVFLLAAPPRLQAVSEVKVQALPEVQVQALRQAEASLLLVVAGAGDPSPAEVGAGDPSPAEVGAVAEGLVQPGP